MPAELVWPLTLTASGREATVQQGSLGEVQQGVDLLMTCTAGSLLYDPEFGRGELAFSQDPEGAIERLIVEQAPRVAQYSLNGTVKTGFTVEVTGVATYVEAVDG